MNLPGEQQRRSTEDGGASAAAGVLGVGDSVRSSKRCRAAAVVGAADASGAASEDGMGGRHRCSGVSDETKHGAHYSYEVSASLYHEG